MDIHQFEALIFDLGGVIINLDQPATYQAFARLSGKPVEEVTKLASSESFFQDYELGKMDDPTFRAHIREALSILNSDDEIDAAWNAMLKEIPAARLQMIDQLASKYKLFIMSNTNEIHYRQIVRIASHAAPRKSLNDFFDQVYLSQEIGERKPNPGAWQVILDDHGLNPAATLFIDDKLDNNRAAEALGIQTFHNVSPDDWIELFR